MAAACPSGQQCLSVMMASGSFCSPACVGSECPAAPPGVTAQPACALTEARGWIRSMADTRLETRVCRDLSRHPDSCGCSDTPRLPPEIPVETAPSGQGGRHLPGDIVAGRDEQHSEVLEQMRDIKGSLKREVGAMRPTNPATFNKKHNR